ncbi:beta-ketoacyl-[acyl-carrier-protein] synthase family protein [Streptomyces sp. NPDC052676]|uniref:beta-ketoacyl-[acyl-carrier-protein] synthase family protein n=1 Tax=Streptomyces sp. NPDC052676 TaxID=3154953 RepID=UPI0034162B8F
MSVEPAVITGLGAVTPAGTTLDDIWSALCAGRSLAAPDPRLAGLPVDFSCRVTGFDAEAELGRGRIRRLDDPALFALAAARRAVAHAGLDPTAWRSERVGVVLGVGSNSLTTYSTEFAHLTNGAATRVSPWAVPRSVPNMVAAEVAIDLRAQGPNFTVSSACASGATAIGVARDMLRAGVCDIVLAGGSESGCTPMTAACFHQMRALSRRRDQPHLASRPFDCERDGFVLGEGAAVLVLERRATAKARNATALALVQGYGAGCDAYHPIAPSPQGEGTVRAVRTALKDAGRTTARIGHVNAHGTSTRLNDAAETAALSRVFAKRCPPVTAPKGVIGHSLGASGAIDAVCTVLSLVHQVIPPTANFGVQDGEACKLDVVAGLPRPAAMTTALSTSCGFGGQNAALVFALE